MINPASGDSTAQIFSDPDSSSEPLETVPVGTMFKVIGKVGNYYEIDYESSDPGEACGGSGYTGVVMAYPYAKLYLDITKSKIIGNVNNGTTITILNDDSPHIYQISTLSTNGELTGYIDAKYIFRDNTSDPRLFRSGNPANSVIKTGKVNTPSGLNYRTGPGTSYKKLGAYPNGTSLNIHEVRNGWYRTDRGWVSGRYVKITNSNTTGNVSKTDTTVVGNKPAQPSNIYKDSYNTKESNDVYIGNFTNYGYDPNKKLDNDEYYTQLTNKYCYALGMPPRYNMDIDLQYAENLIGGAGRVYSKTLLSYPSILSICPGKVKMFPNLLGNEKSKLAGLATAYAGNNQSLKSKLNSESEDAFSSKMYSFNADTATYASYLNVLCRACAIMLGIGDRTMPMNGSALKNFDYSYWTIRKKYNVYSALSAGGESAQENSIFTNFWSNMIGSATKVVDAAVSDNTYINFFLNGNETSVSESIQTAISDSPLSNILNIGDDIGDTINYFTNSGFNITDSDASTAINEILADSKVVGLKTIATNMLKGGKMVIPKMLSASSYSKSISCNLKFMSPYGDPYSVFLKCLVPICHLLAMALPRQLTDNMYTYPSIVRASQLGCFTMDIGIISDLQIVRGGNDDTSWTTKPLATEWDVQLTLTPLVDDLMITSSSHPLLFVKNEGLLDYLSNFCGFDMLACNIDTKIEMMWNFFKNRITDLPPSLANKLNDTMFNKLNRYFTFQS